MSSAHPQLHVSEFWSKERKWSLALVVVCLLAATAACVPEEEDEPDPTPTRVDVGDTISVTNAGTDVDATPVSGSGRVLYTASFVETDTSGRALMSFAPLFGKNGSCDVNMLTDAVTQLTTRVPDAEKHFFTQHAGKTWCWFGGTRPGSLEVDPGIVVSFLDPAIRIVSDLNEIRIAVGAGEIVVLATEEVLDSEQEFSLEAGEEIFFDLEARGFRRTDADFTEVDDEAFARLEELSQ